MAAPSKPSESFNSQFKKQNEDVAKDLATKLKLEYGFKKDLRKFFSDLTNKFEKSYAESGHVVGASTYQDELRKILIKNYKIIGKNFSSKLRMQGKNLLWNIEHKGMDSSQALNQYFIELKQLDNNIDNQLYGYIDSHSDDQADIITQTNQDDLGSSVSKVMNAAALAGVLLSKKEVAQQASADFERKVLPRIDTIATTETQNMAEYAKWLEASNINNIRALGSTNYNQLKKQWVTILDERTRLDHVTADGQIQFVTVPYQVGGDKMMTPGDPSLGAAVGNFINCRCSSLFILPEGSDAESVDPTLPINSSSKDLVTSWVDPKNGEEFGLTRGYATTYAEQGSKGQFLLKEDVDLALQKLKDDKVEYIPMYYKHNAYKDGTTERNDKNMDTNKIIGWFKVNDLISTKTGLYTEGYVNTVTPGRPGWGAGAIKEIKDGKLKAFSIGYIKTEDIKLPSGSSVHRGLTIKEISLVPTGDLPTSVLMPINQSKPTGQLKPKVKPQKPVDPHAPQSFDPTGMTPKQIAEYGITDSLGFGTNAEIEQEITEDLASGYIDAAQAARRRALLASRIGPTRNMLDGLTEQQIIEVGRENYSLIEARDEANKLTSLQAITRNRPINRVLYGDEWGILTNDQVDSYVRSMTLRDLMTEKEAQAIRNALPSRLPKPEPKPLPKPIPGTLPNTARFTQEELSMYGDEYGFMTNEEVEKQAISDYWSGLITNDELMEIRKTLKTRIAPIKGAGVLDPNSALAILLAGDKK